MKGRPDLFLVSLNNEHLTKTKRNDQMRPSKSFFFLNDKRHLLLLIEKKLNAVMI